MSSPPPPLPVEQVGESATTAGDSAHQRSLPTPFLTKTHQLVDDASCDDMISWSDDGSSFVVWKPAEFARDLLPKYFKHNNFSSFVRQLNTYGFRKVVPDRWEFTNDCFRKGEKSLLREIQRRKISQAAASGAPITGATPRHPPPTAAAGATVQRMTISPSVSGEEQVLSAHSSPAAGLPSGSGGGSSANHHNCIGSGGVSCSTPELVEENDRLSKENAQLTQELNQMRGLCNNILALMSNYASRQQETGGLLDGRELDLLPPAATDGDGCGCVEGRGGGWSGDSGGRVEDEEAWTRLFGVSIGGKRARREEEDEDDDNRGNQQRSDD